MKELIHVQVTPGQMALAAAMNNNLKLYKSICQTAEIDPLSLAYITDPNWTIPRILFTTYELVARGHLVTLEEMLVNNGLPLYPMVDYPNRQKARRQELQQQLNAVQTELACTGYLNGAPLREEEQRLKAALQHTEKYGVPYRCSSHSSYARVCAADNRKTLTQLQKSEPTKRVQLRIAEIEALLETLVKIEELCRSLESRSPRPAAL